VALSAALVSTCLGISFAIILAAPARSLAGAPACRGSALAPVRSDLRELARATLCLVNDVRATHHLHRLHANTHLGSAAANALALMIQDDYFADVGPGGQTPLSLIVGSGYVHAGETIQWGQNLAWGSGPKSTPASIVNAWMHSPPHRAIILDPTFADAGAAATPAVPPVMGGGVAGATYAIEFALR
jgi:uncharacterized protein YkwD